MSIPFSAWVDLGAAIAEAFNNPRDRRRHRPERQRWEVAAIALADPLLDTSLHGGFTSTPYLVAHPEREIAEVRDVQWHCEACRETGSDLPFFWTKGQIIKRAIAAAHRHNAERHPRRWARSQNFSGSVALNEARRVTRWGADA